jgi:hypothetical protein
MISDDCFSLFDLFLGLVGCGFRLSLLEIREVMVTVRMPAGTLVAVYLRQIVFLREVSLEYYLPCIFRRCTTWRAFRRCYRTRRYLHARGNGERKMIALAWYIEVCCLRLVESKAEASLPQGDGCHHYNLIRHSRPCLVS